METGSQSIVCRLTTSFYNPVPAHELLKVTCRKVTALTNEETGDVVMSTQGVQGSEALLDQFDTSPMPTSTAN